MKPYQKSRLKLLEELEEIVSDEVTKRHGVRFDNKDEKRAYRKMKLIGKELDKWIKEMKRDEKLRKQERELNEQKRLEAAKNATERFNADQ